MLVYNEGGFIVPRSKDRVVIYFRWQGKRLTASGKDRTEAEINKALKLKQLEEDTIILNSSTLVRHWIDEWLETYKYGQVNDSWFRDIKKICKNYIIHEIGNTKLLMTKPLHLQRIINFNTKSKSFNDKLYDIITQIFKTAYENGLTNKNIAENKKEPNDYVCVNLKGNRYTKKTYTTMWEKIRRLMDIEMGAEVYRNEIIKSVIADDFVIYNLRHTFCTDLQSAGVPINVARELMGHSSIDITSKIYTHHSEISISDALEKMNRFSSSK